MPRQQTHKRVESSSYRTRLIWPHALVAAELVQHLQPSPGLLRETGSTRQGAHFGHKFELTLGMIDDIHRHRKKRLRRVMPRQGKQQGEARLWLCSSFRTTLTSSFDFRHNVICHLSSHVHLGAKGSANITPKLL